MKPRRKLSAFTLIELLAVIAIITLLMSLLLPALQAARRSARNLISAHNQRTIATSVACYGSDNRGRFPESVATLGSGSRWSWREPTVLISFQQRSPKFYRSVSQYLQQYIDNAQDMFCPSAPSEYEFAQKAWAAGDAWDNPSPDTDGLDALFGNYCLYWNYVGYLAPGRSFSGPRSASDGRAQSKLLISDYFGYGHWRNELAYGTREAYGSCEKMADADITRGTPVACDFWSVKNSANITLSNLHLNFKAGYVDGHVASFSAPHAVPLQVSLTPDGLVPYPDNIGPAGTIYLPSNY